MKLHEFNQLLGQDSYVRCIGKERIDPAIVTEEEADHHIFSGGQVGWWVRSGYIIVDIDEGKEEALKIIKKLKLKTLICQTPKGLHLYFKTDKDFPQKVGMVTPFGLKCDYRCANKGYVLLPFGSDDPERKFNRCKEIAELPPEFTPIPNRKDSLLGLKEGQGRNATLFAHLMAYKNRGAGEDSIQVMGEIINSIIFEEPMAKSELDKIVQNTKKYEATPLGDNPYLIYNQKGFATGVNYRSIVDYFVNSGSIFVLGGECYRYSEGMYKEASSYVRNTIREMIADDRFISHGRIMEAYRLLIDDTRIQKSAKELNPDKNLINFRNGVWDISEGKMIEHSSVFLQTIQIDRQVKSIEEVPALEDTRLHRFLKTKCKMKKADVNMILQYFAYCLTLDFGLKTFMILYGQSNTGKSVLIRFLENMIGYQNASSLSMHELNMRFYPSQLYNRLLNSCADNSALPLSSIENLKKITGGDQIMHEKKGRDPFFFVPFAKLIFSFNQLPLQLEEKSNAFYKRMRILYMNKELFLDNEYVEDLCGEESVEEIIPHLLERLPLKTIPRTRTSNRLVEAMRNDSDSIHAFMNEECEVGDALTVDKKALYDAYAKFCIDHGREAHKKHSFIRHMRSQGMVESRDPSTRQTCWKGLTFKARKSRRRKA